MKASEQPKKTHAVVLRALEVANMTLNRAATIEEVIEALTAEERELLERTYDFSLGAAIGSILRLLSIPSKERGLVYSPGLTSSRRRAFAAVRVLKPEDAVMPETATRREHVLVLVRHAVRELGRAIRITDAIAFAEGKPEYACLSPGMIQNAIIAARIKGKLSVAKTLHGLHRHLYLPSDLNAEGYAPSEPLSWQEWVKQAFEELWDERLQEAEGRLPKPITTRQVRARLESMGCDDPKLQGKASVVSALFELSKHSNAAIRRISRRSRKSLLWAPVNVPDERLDLDNTYANDMERIGEAVRRAVARHERPVGLKEIEREIEADPALKLVNYASPSKAVTATVDYSEPRNAKRGRRKYPNGYMQSVGLLANKALYFHCGGGAEHARAYVEFRRLELGWKELRADQHLYDIEGCKLATVATGRAMLLAAEAARVGNRLRTMIDDGLLVGQWADEAEVLCAQVEGAAERARSWPSAFATNGRKLPKQVSTLVTTVTKEELRALLEPIYPNVQKLERAYQVTTLLATRIRRVFVEGRMHPAFDRTDALLFAARRFGGKECCLQAGLAAAEVGVLRDARFIYPAIDSKDADARLIAVACLAYIPSPEGNELLKQRAMKDVELGIRQSALWSYAFAGGELAKELASVMAKHDPDTDVREFAARVYEAASAGLWHL